MAVDASIPLSGAQFDLGKSLSLADMMGQLNQRKQAAQGQMTLRNIFANPQNLDATTGMPNPQAMAQIMAVDPATGMKVMQNGLAMQGERAKLDDHKMARFATIQELVDPVRTAALAAHEEARKQGQSEEQAVEAGQRALNDGLTDIEKGGVLSEAEKGQLSRKFDPMQFAARSRDWQVMQKERAATARADRSQAETERHNQAAEGGAGTAMDDDGLNYAADNYRKTGQLPAMGSGAAGGAVRAKIIARAAERAKAEGKTGAQDADARASEKQGAPLSDEAASIIAERMIAGDRQASQGFARSPRNLAKIINTFTEKAIAKGMDGADIAARTAEFAGVLAGERALGGRTAQVGMAVNEAKQFADLALDASAKVWRSKFVPVASLVQSYEKGTNDPDVRAFGAANLSFINAYSRAVSPTGVPTVSDRDHAREMLSTVYDQKSYKAVIDQLQREMDAAIKSPGAVRQEFREAITGKAGPGNPAGTNAPAGASPAAAASSAAPKPEAGVYKDVTAAQYDALPSGAHWTKPGDPPGKVRIKP